MASECNESVYNSINGQQDNESNSEDDLIDLDKVLPVEKDSNWLLESNNNGSDFYVSFKELRFSNPLIKNVINNIYLNGKSKHVLHHLMYWNDRMTISCDNYAYLCTPYKSVKESKKRLSLSINGSRVVEDDSESPTDSLNSNESLHKINVGNVNNTGHHIDLINDRMTQSSITDYNLKQYVPQESEKLPSTKNSSSQNVLSRTYDKEDLEILKQNQAFSHSVYVPHISGSKIEQYSEVESREKVPIQRNLSLRKKNTETFKSSSFKRLFPTADSSKTAKDSIIKPRPNSMYQMDKLSKNTIDRCVKISQQKSFNINPRSLFRTNEKIFDADVLTPINSPRNLKYFSNNNNNNRESRMKYLTKRNDR